MQNEWPRTCKQTPENIFRIPVCSSTKKNAEHANNPHRTRIAVLPELLVNIFANVACSTSIALSFRETIRVYLAFDLFWQKVTVCWSTDNFELK